MKPIILILAGLLCTVLEWVRIIQFKSLLIIKPVETANNKVTALQYTFLVYPWAMYSLFGLIVAYNLYIKNA
jgi:choline-glycine betaine transporter